MRWTVGAKISGGFALAVLILLLIGVLSYRSTRRLIEAAAWRDHANVVLLQLEAVHGQLLDAVRNERGYLLTGQDIYLEPYRAAQERIITILDAVRKITSDNPNQQQRLDEVSPLISSYFDTLQKEIAIRKNAGIANVVIEVQKGDVKRLVENIRNHVNAMQSEERALLTRRIGAAEASANHTLYTIIGGTFIAIVILMLAAFLIAQNISKPLREITASAEQIAAGDLAVAITTSHRRDEVGSLMHAFARMSRSLNEMAAVARRIADGDLRVRVNPQSEKDVLGSAFLTMTEKLKALTSEIVECVAVLGSSADQISTSSAQLAASAQQTAAAVTETTTTVGEVRQTAQVASEKARSVSQRAVTTAQVSQSGKKSIDEFVEEMERIRQQVELIASSMMRLNEHTQAIGQIIATVDDLAAQSNILAINAAIEAAKAGEQGKGFTVVAQEVRSLAEQSKQATNQVRTILGDIQKAAVEAMMATEHGSKAVNKGVKLVSQAGQSIQILASNVSEGADAATQIAASSQQQLVGVDQVAVAMESIKQASTQNVVSARQLEGAARNLTKAGRNLKQFVEQYKI
jgi:methyl-accepting chemotaxis protein